MASTPVSPTGELDAFSLLGRYIAEEFVHRSNVYNDNNPDAQSRALAADDPETSQSALQALPVAKSRKEVGIIGAGAAGLYAAMMLQDLGITYEILEASKRSGGRLYTHRFTPKVADSPEDHDYYVSRCFALFMKPLIHKIIGRWRDALSKD